MIEICNLTKRYGKKTILSDISVTMKPGTVYGLVGANGSGKTTLMRCICGFTQPTFGKITVNGTQIGKDVDFPQNTGIIIETPGFLPYYSASQNLKLLISDKTIDKNKEIARVLSLVHLNPSERKPVEQYSLGMRQRLGIAQALLGDPEILILDEPFNGIDKSGVLELHRLIARLKNEGKLILLASHSEMDIIQSCDEVYEIIDGILMTMQTCGKEVKENKRYSDLMTELYRELNKPESNVDVLKINQVLTELDSHLSQPQNRFDGADLYNQILSKIEEQ